MPIAEDDYLGCGYNRTISWRSRLLKNVEGGGTFILILYIQKTFVYRFVLQQDDSDFEPVYIVATFLDPFLSLYLDHELRTR